MALVLAASAPSGADDVCELRALITARLFFSSVPVPRFAAPPTLRHVDGMFHCYTSCRIYVGSGKSDCQGRPSPWANPFEFLDRDLSSSLSSFSSYLFDRADIVSFLFPLAGKELVCDCNNGANCHGHILMSRFSDVFTSTASADSLPRNVDAPIACSNSLNDASFEPGLELFSELCADADSNPDFFLLEVCIPCVSDSGRGSRPPELLGRLACSVSCHRGGACPAWGGRPGRLRFVHCSGQPCPALVCAFVAYSSSSGSLPRCSAACFFSSTLLVCLRSCPPPRAARCSCVCALRWHT